MSALVIQRKPTYLNGEDLTGKAGKLVGCLSAVVYLFTSAIDRSSPETTLPPIGQGCLKSRRDLLEAAPSARATARSALNTHGGLIAVGARVMVATDNVSLHPMVQDKTCRVGMMATPSRAACVTPAMG